VRNHLQTQEPDKRQLQQTKSTGKLRKKQQEGEEVFLVKGESGIFVNFSKQLF